MVSASNFSSVDKDTLVSSVNGFLPNIAVIPLAEHDEVVEVLVSEGARVKEGEVIAKARGIHIHSSIPGIVRGIERRQYSNGKQGLCAIIALDGSFSFLGKKLPHQEWQQYERTTVEYLLKEAGIVNTFSKNVPIYSQMKKIRTVSSNVLVLRLFDEDPSLITESFVARTFLPTVLEGAGVLARAFGAKACVIAYSEEEGIKSAIDAQLASGGNALFPAETEVFSVGLDTHKYPTGSMHDIVSAVKKTYKGEIFARLGRKDLFVDSTTALNAYNAIVLGKPVVSNFVHVTGDCLNAAALLNVREGTSLRSVVEQCGGFKRRLSKIIINGIVLGKAVSSLDIPVSRGVKSVEFVPCSQVSFQNTENCIRCGNCRKICPVHLWPGNLYRVARLSRSEIVSEGDRGAFQSAILCTECGLCNAVCPSRLPLSQTISLLKDSFNED